MTPKTIGIIGIEGKYGRWLKRFFEKLEYEVIGSDVLSENADNKAVVEKADVVIFAVSLGKTVEAIEEVVPVSRVDQLWIDISSLKVAIVDAMLASKAEVVGLHPMCAPPKIDTWKGQIVVVCPVRADQWRNWTLDMLKEKGQAQVVESSPEDHDAKMAFIQGLPHAANLTMASVLKRTETDVSKCLEYTSSFYRLAWSSMARILSMDAQLYADIQLLNSQNTLEVIRTLEQEAKALRKIIEGGTREALLKKFRENSEHFGENNLDPGNQLFDRLIGVMVDLSSGNLIAFQANEDRPGLLHEIIGFLAKHKINMTSLHSFKADCGHRFMIGIEDPPTSEKVRHAIDEIEGKIGGVTFRDSLKL